MNKENKILTICIPTYNRKPLISQLLKNIEQNCSSPKDIEVIIIDDGSSDNTDNHVCSQLNNFRYNLYYYKKENGEKLSAIRLGLAKASGQYFMDMDTDDLFPYLGVDVIIEELKAIGGNKQFDAKELPIAGVVGLAHDKNNILLGTNFPKDSMVTNLTKIRADYNVRGDKKEVVLTEYLKKIKIDFYTGEKRFPTSIVWLKLSAFANVIFVNKQFIIKSYLKDGLSSNMLKRRINSPNCAMAIYKEILSLNNYSSIIYRSRVSN